VAWREQLVETIQIRRKLGARHNVIIVAEGGMHARVLGLLFVVWLD
jgi:hypothetical protein